MTKQAVGKGPMWAGWGFRSGAFFGVLLVALICSAVVGTQSVRAQSACTSQQCTDAHNYADTVCAQHSSTIEFFKCPSNAPVNDDFFFRCYGNYTENHDCSDVFNPS